MQMLSRCLQYPFSKKKFNASCVPFHDLDTNEDSRLRAPIWIGHVSSMSSFPSSSDSTSTNGRNAAFSMIQVVAGIGQKTSPPYNDMYLLECRNFQRFQASILAAYSKSPHFSVSKIGIVNTFGASTLNSKER